MRIKNIVRFCALLILSILLAPLILIFILSNPIFDSTITTYLNDKFWNQNHDFVTQAFEQIPTARPGQTTLMLAADVSEQDAILPIEKGYTLIAHECMMNSCTFMPPKDSSVKIIHGFDSESLPDLDVVMARFIFPLYTPEKFEKIWQIIDRKIKPGGYFIGNFFDPQFEIFKDKERKTMSFLGKDEILLLFKNYEIVKMEVVKKISPAQNGLEYYYEIFAKKKDYGVFLYPR
ncbi:MAG: hypothetical protein NTX76_00055 [Alphaproteobacteria bacterium]|nr:hypothetical protein [Alphaproteobacteria bacterium]